MKRQFLIKALRSFISVTSRFSHRPVTSWQGHLTSAATFLAKNFSCAREAIRVVCCAHCIEEEEEKKVASLQRSQEKPPGMLAALSCKKHEERREECNFSSQSHIHKEAGRKGSCRFHAPCEPSLQKLSSQFAFS